VNDVAPLPGSLLTRDAPAHGVGRAVLRTGEFERVRRGVWVPGGLDLSDADVRISAVAAQLPPHAAIGGWSAARLHERAVVVDDLEVFDGGRRWEEGPSVAPGGVARVVVCSARDSRMVLRPDVRVFRSPAVDRERTLLAGVAVTSGPRTAFDLARLLPMHRAVVALDRLLHLGVVDPAELADLLVIHRRGVGLPAARRAMTLADGGAESPQESLMRLAWVGAGLPRPSCNPVVRDPGGRFVARVDLIDGTAGVVGEYDGAVHADAERRSRDTRRQEELEALGLLVVRATAADLTSDGHGIRLAARLRSAYQRAARRPPERRRWVVAA